MGGAASAEIDRPRASGEVLPDDGGSRLIGGVALTGAEADEVKQRAIEIFGRFPPISYDMVVLLAEGVKPSAVAERLGMSNEKLTELYGQLLGTLGVSTAAEALATIIELLQSLGHDVNYEPRPALEPEQKVPVVERPAWFYTLTTREIEILFYICEGKTNQQIADVRVVTIQTIKFHVSNIFRKLGVSNRTAAVSEAIKSGFLDEEPSVTEPTIA